MWTFQASAASCIYSSKNISGIFIRNEYVQAVKDIVAFCKGNEFAPNADDNEGSNDEADMAMRRGDVGLDGDTVMGTSVHVAEFSVAPTPFPSTIDNPFLGTEFPLKHQRSGVIVTGSPGIGEYNCMVCVGYLTHSIQANLCYWMSSCTCVILPGVPLFLFRTRAMQISSPFPASPEF